MPVNDVSSRPAGRSHSSSPGTLGAGSLEHVLTLGERVKLALKGIDENLGVREGLDVGSHCDGESTGVGQDSERDRHVPGHRIEWDHLGDDRAKEGNGLAGAAKVGDNGGDQVLPFDEPAQDAEQFRQEILIPSAADNY